MDETEINWIKQSDAERQCRLCMRMYDISQLEEIFPVEWDCNVQNLIQTAVSVQVHHEDPTTSICVICKDLIHLINDFKIACQQANFLLDKGGYVLSSDLWSNDLLSEAATVVKHHRQEIESIFSSTEDTIKDNDDESLTDNFDEAAKTSLVHIVCEPVDPEYMVEYLEETKDEIKKEDNSSDSQPENSDQELSLDFTESEGISNMPISEDEGLLYTDDESIAEKYNSVPPESVPNKTANTGRNIEKVVCATCGEMVSKQSCEGHFNRHLGVQPFACVFPGCKARLYSKFALKQHRSRHTTNNKYYDCKVCGKRIKGTSYWLTHRKLHTEEPKYPCDICGKKFRRKHKLKIHSTVHSGIAEFPCEICGKYFTIKHNLMAHYKLHIRNGTYPTDMQLANASKHKTDIK